MKTYTVEANKNGYYIEKHTSQKPVYFAGMRQGKPQFVIWSTHVRYFKTLKTAEKHLAALKGDKTK